MNGLEKILVAGAIAMMLSGCGKAEGKDYVARDDIAWQDTLKVYKPNYMPADGTYVAIKK